MLVIIANTAAGPQAIGVAQPFPAPGESMPERQVPSHRVEIAGATLVVSTSGGYSVLYGGVYIGYIHASVGDRWNAYVRRVNAPPDHLGKLCQEDAVRRIISVYRSTVSEKAVV